MTAGKPRNCTDTLTGSLEATTRMTSVLSWAWFLSGDKNNQKDHLSNCSCRYISNIFEHFTYIRVCISKSLANKISRDVLSRMHCGETRESVARLVAQEILDETRITEEELSWLLPVAIVVPLLFITVVVTVIGKPFKNKHAMFRVNLFRSRNDDVSGFSQS